jgi:hypothetical protein
MVTSLLVDLGTGNRNVLGLAEIIDEWEISSGTLVPELDHVTGNDGRRVRDIGDIVGAGSTGEAFDDSSTTEPSKSSPLDSDYNPLTCAVRTVGGNGTDVVSELAVIGLAGDDHRSFFASSITTEYECTRATGVKKMQTRDHYILPSSLLTPTSRSSPKPRAGCVGQRGREEDAPNVSGVEKPSDSSTR